MKNKDEFNCVDNEKEEDINFLIWQIMKMWLKGKQRLLDEFGLTASQMETLSTIYHLGQTEPKVTQIAISNVTYIDPMTTSTILKNLQKKKLITRKVSKIDTRARTVEVTEEGRKLFFEAAKKMRLSTEFVFSQLDKEALRTQLKTLLNVISK